MRILLLTAVLTVASALTAQAHGGFRFDLAYRPIYTSPFRQDNPYPAFGSVYYNRVPYGGTFGYAPLYRTPCVYPRQSRVRLYYSW